MALFRMVARYQLLWLVYPLAIGNFHRLCRRSNPVGGSDELHFIFLGTLAVAVVYLLKLRVVLAPHVDEAGSLPAGANRSERASLRGMLLVAVGLSAAAAFLAIGIFQDVCAAFLGCTRWPVAAVLTVIMALVHGCFAWVAVCKD